MVRLELRVYGLVQGVGFRPFVNRLAALHSLSGSVFNGPDGVTIEVEGPDPAVAAFARDLRLQAPPLAVIARVEERALPPRGERGFRIIPSQAPSSGASALVPPDVATCQRCLAELRDPADRRFRYPFINCTDCGPRFTIIAGVPYDRPLTTMAAFVMCERCQQEYDDPASRRHHAQPNACGDCGPRLRIADAAGAPLAAADPTLAAILRLEAGQIGAVKGLGGFHLACDAGNRDAVRRLRERKRRPDKPLAVMVRDLDAARRLADLDEVEREILTGWRRPIVLAPARRPSPLAPEVGGTSRQVGVMLAYAPLHHLLLEGSFPALVMTSGNRSDEPIVCDDADAVVRLAGIADFFVLHDRPILQRADDSVARVSRGRPLLLRRSRGFVPEPILLPASGKPVLAVGGDLKNAACLSRGNLAFTTAYIGDLAHPDAAAGLTTSITHLSQLLGVRLALVVHDAHPDYVSTRTAEHLAETLGVPRLAVQHHHAHALACLAENGWSKPALALVLDGQGWAPDGTIWGGELLAVDGLSYRRLARLRPLPQPGGDAATRQPWRMAVAALHAAFAPDDPCWPRLRGLPPLTAAPAETVAAVEHLVQVGGACPVTSSAGRLFDAVAALIGLRQQITYEGQAAIELEDLAATSTAARRYDLPLREAGVPELDSAVLLRAVASDVLDQAPVAEIALGFHRALVVGLSLACASARRTTGLAAVALSGGVLQNRLLEEDLTDALEARGFAVLSHRQVSPNDGGLALGQVWAGVLSQAS